MAVIHPGFFKGNDYFIDERVGLFKLTNQYKIYDTTAQHIGTIRQVMSGGQKIARLFLNKNMLPFRMEITDVNGVVLATIQRGWTFWMSKITITDHTGQNIGNIRQKFKLFRSKFEVLDATGQKTAEVNGDWKAWVFTITNGQGMELAQVTKKWSGMAKELFTTADKYIVTISPLAADPQQKLRALSIAITMDMLLKESK